MTRNTLARMLAVAGLSSAMCSLAWSGQRQVLDELAKIPAVAQSNVLARLQGCHIKVTTNSWVGVVPVDSPAQGYKAGDEVIWAEIDVPPPPAAKATTDVQVKSLSAGWVKRGGQYNPTTGWAKNLQEHPAPLWWLKC